MGTAGHQRERSNDRQVQRERFRMVHVYLIVRRLLYYEVILLYLILLDQSRMTSRTIVIKIEHESGQILLSNYPRQRVTPVDARISACHVRNSQPSPRGHQ